MPTIDAIMQQNSEPTSRTSSNLISKDVKMSQQFGNTQNFTGSAYNYICENMGQLAEAVQPERQDFNFLQYFLNDPALKELIDVKFAYFYFFLFRFSKFFFLF
jgi:hypothetical protein